MRIPRSHLLQFMPLLLTSCIYQRITQPLDLNFTETPVFQRSNQSDIKHFKYLLVDFQWDSNAIGQIAKQHGLSEIYYADLETLSILRVWNRYSVQIYGR